MLLGNLASFIFVLIAEIDSLFMDVIAILTLFLNLVYVVMTYQKSIELGINPWKRW